MEGRPIGSPIEDARDFGARLKHVMGKLQRDEKQELITLVNFLEVKASKNRVLKGAQEVQTAAGITKAVNKLYNGIATGITALQEQVKFLKGELVKKDAEVEKLEELDEPCVGSGPVFEAAAPEASDVAGEVRALDVEPAPESPNEDEALDDVFGGS